MEKRDRASNQDGQGRGDRKPGKGGDQQEEGRSGEDHHGSLDQGVRTGRDDNESSGERPGAG